MSDNPAPENADSNKRSSNSSSSTSLSSSGNRSDGSGVVVLTPADRMNNNHCNAQTKLGCSEEADEEYNNLKIESLKITDNLNAKHTLSYDVSYLNGSSTSSSSCNSSPSDQQHPSPHQQPQPQQPQQTKSGSHSSSSLALSSSSIDIKDKNDLNAVKLFAYAICREYLGGIWKSISPEQFELIKLT